ncbi:MAG: hypothetical protein GY786_06780, partial [Proteobacteria bacterium]|nr:hypothetical protein [Pseudomonadota bacterium]
DYLDRLTSLLIHEYSHILHIDKIGDRARIKRDILGRFPISFPALFQPTWVLEGLASYLESKQSSEVGRGQSSYYRMLMRMELLSGIKPFNQVNQPIETWPGGITPYLYGVYFYNFLDEVYGERKIQNWITRYNDTIIPFQINGIATEVFGKSLKKLWHEFELFLKEEFATELDRIVKSGLKAGIPLTHSGAQTSHPRLGEKGDLFYIRENSVGASSLTKLTTDSIKSLTSVRGMRFDYHSKSGFIIVQTTPFGKTARYSDIYKISGDGHEIRALTRGGRYRFAVWHPHGKTIMAVHNKLGRSSLHLLNSEGELVKKLWQGEAGVVVSNPDWDPSGDRVVASVKRAGGSWNLEIFNMQNRTWSKLTDNRFIEGQPHFGKDGQKIYYSAEYDRFYNIYSIDLQSMNIKRITRVPGGAFYPQSADDEHLVYKGANKNGFDIYQIKIDEEDYLPPSRKPITLQNGGNILPKPSEVEAVDYQPMVDFFPTWWFPYLSLTQTRKIVGLITSTGDPLEHHQIDLLLAYESENNLPIWGLSYRYDAMRPTLQFVSRREYSNAYDDNQNFSHLRAETGTSVFAGLYLPGLYSSWNIRAGVMQIDERDLPDNVATEKYAKKDNMLGISISLSSLYGGSRAINYTEGLYGILSYVDSDTLDGDYQGKTLGFEQGGFIHLGSNHILSEQFAFGFGSKTGRPFVLNSGIPLFSSDSTARLTSNNFLFDRDVFSRRAYELQGYETDSDELAGERFLYSNLAWYFPLGLWERGLTAPPVGIHKYHGSLFFSFGDAWTDSEENMDLRRSVGLEVTVETILGYQLPFNIKTGLVKGLDNGGGLGWYFQFSRLI